jgi:hypothetical protein
MTPTMPCTGRSTSGASLAGFAPVKADVGATQMPSVPRSSKAVAAPPQLMGIIDDARRAGVDTFTLEYSRAIVMASFSSLNHATEIDFEFKSGEEMFRFLLAGAPSRTAKQWSIQFVHNSGTYSIMIQRAGIRPKSRLQVKWSGVVDGA